MAKIKKNLIKTQIKQVQGGVLCYFCAKFVTAIQRIRKVKLKQYNKMSQNIAFMDAVKACFSKYADFNGRSPRAEYWYFTLFNVAVFILLVVLATVIGKLFMFVYYAYMLAILVPSIAVSIRRMHDIGRSGLWVLISLVPMIGSIWFIVLAALPSQLGPNKFGPNPYGQNTIA